MAVRLLLWTVSTFLLCTVRAKVSQIDLPIGLTNCFHDYSTKTAVTKMPGSCINWSCVQMFVWDLADSLNMTQVHHTWLGTLLINPRRQRRTKRSHGALRLRKEYRRLSNRERINFHRAINLLKQDTSVPPNRYDALALLHRDMNIPRAHRGPNFLGWHRVYLVMYENALRQKVPGVTLPYWASNLDNGLGDPTQSILWSRRFMGNGDGLVTSGPFANWATPSGPLTRNIGTGQLFTDEAVNNVVSQMWHRDITEPNAQPQNNLEGHHNLVHMWVAGQMNQLDSSPQDPIFFLHHAFVDLVWEEFRLDQWRAGIDPTTDYPADFGNPLHAPDARMEFGDLLNIDGYSDFWTSFIYTYEPVPTCISKNIECGTQFLRCSGAARGRPKCVPVVRDNYDPSDPEGNEGTCPAFNLMPAFQNTFSCNERQDIREWAYIPVSVIVQRPPEFQYPGQYPVYESRPSTRSDLYNPRSYEGTRNRYQSGSGPATFPNCQGKTGGTGKIFVEAYGINYQGSYKEFSVVDYRPAFSMSTMYIAVPNPQKFFPSVETFVAAYDSCGRVCRPCCRSGSSARPIYRPCSGALRINTEMPLGFGVDFGGGLSTVWNIPPERNGIPRFQPERIYLQFICDYDVSWPWKHHATVVQVIPPSGQLSVMQAKPKARRNECVINKSCVIPAPCYPCRNNTKFVCRGTKLYGFCVKGKWRVTYT